MSPVLNHKRDNFSFTPKNILVILSSICILLMLITYATPVFDQPINSAFGYLVIPFESGISRVGEWLGHRTEEMASVRSLLAENEALREEVARLTEENTILLQERYELTRLRELVKLNDEYGTYPKVGARIIAKDAGNWFESFVIDKGADDGLMVDMNVLAGGGLVGRITEVGSNWSRVTAMISDGVFVSGQILATGSTLMVKGELELRSDNLVSFSQLRDPDNYVTEGDKVVTSQISDKYLPNLLVGYITEIRMDSNNLTKSGYLSPAVDFENLSEVLVITQMKNVDYLTEH